MATNAVLNKNSRYVQGGTTDRFNNRLGWWERRIIKESDSDVFFTVSNEYVQRPDLIAKEMFGQETAAWLVLQYNNIVDIVEELVDGKELRLPTYERFTLDIMTQPVGGNKIG